MIDPLGAKLAFWGTLLGLMLCLACTAISHRAAATSPQVEARHG
jgi:hypothetical protein